MFAKYLEKKGNVNVKRVPFHPILSFLFIIQVCRFVSFILEFVVFFLYTHSQGYDDYYDIIIKTIQI